MDDYIKGNKQAWEDAFDHRLPSFGQDVAEALKNKTLPYFSPDMKALLQSMDWQGKQVAQFCCNNGRELMGLLQLGAAHGTGFDIAENILAQGRDIAEKAGITNCDFVAGDLLSLGSEYSGRFNCIFFTIGAITWFKNLEPLFQKVAECLKPGGVMILNDHHPFMNMLPIEGEEGFIPTAHPRVSYPYFRTEPWQEDTGMSYLSGAYQSKLFTSFSHPMGEIVNACIQNGLCIQRLDEFDYDVGLSNGYDGNSLPLSLLLVAQKTPVGYEV